MVFDESVTEDQNIVVNPISNENEKINLDKQNDSSVVEDQFHFNRTAALIHQKNNKDLTTFLVVMVLAIIFLILVCGILEQEDGKFCGFSHVCCCFGHVKDSSGEYARLLGQDQTFIDNEAKDNQFNIEATTSSEDVLKSISNSSSEGTGGPTFDYGSIDNVEPADSSNLKSTLATIEINNSNSAST